MFFLLTNIAIGKKYPSITTNFIIGLIAYLITIAIFVKVIGKIKAQSYIYYLVGIVIIDTAFLIYQYKFNSKKIKKEDLVIITEEPQEKIKDDNPKKSDNKIDISFSMGANTDKDPNNSISFSI